MRGRHVDSAYNPTAAFWWGTLKYSLLIGAASTLGISLALVFGEWMVHGTWRVTGQAAGVAFLSLLQCALATVAHAMRVHAIDGPPAAAVFDPTGTVFDPDLNRHPGDSDDEQDMLDYEEAQREEAEDARWYGGTS